MTYEYLCTACQHEWEATQPISAAPLKKCPKCKKQTARRQVSGGTGFLLKGGGWYADLYSSAKPAASKDVAEKGGGTEGTTAESKGDAVKSDAGKSDANKPSAKESSKTNKKGSTKAPSSSAA